VRSVQLSGLELEQNVKLQGMDGLKEIDIISFDLPQNMASDHPSGLRGIELAITSSLVNPSQISMEMGSVTFAIQYTTDRDVSPIGNGNSRILGLLSVANFTLKPGTNVIEMKGALLDPESKPSLNPNVAATQIREVVSEFFSRFLAGEKQTMAVLGYSGSRHQESCQQCCALRRRGQSQSRPRKGGSHQGW
jgi:hypothetical protein